MNKQAVCWLVNVLTVIGGGIGLLSLPLAFAGSYRRALLLIGLATTIDGVDGGLIRYFELEETLPEFDGERLDEYADLVTFVVAPLGLAWASGLLPLTLPGLLTGIFIFGTSCLQFSDIRTKQTNSFRGWPAYWNIFFFYAWSLEFSSIPVIILCWLLGGGSFLPVHFIYPSKFKPFRKTTIALGIAWGAGLASYLLVPTAPKWILARIIHESFTFLNYLSL